MKKVSTGSKTGQWSYNSNKDEEVRMKSINLRQLLHSIHLMHLIAIELTEEGVRGLVAYYMLHGNLATGWELSIPAAGVAPLAVPLLKQLGFKLSPGGFYYIHSAPCESQDDTDAGAELIPAKLLYFGNFDSEMMDIMLGLKSGELPPYFSKIKGELALRKNQAFYSSRIAPENSTSKP